MSSMGLETVKELVKILEANVKNRKDTFTIHEDKVECDLGGKFMPVIAEMHEISDRCFDNVGKSFNYNINSIQKFGKNDEFPYNNIVLRLYYEVLRQYANFEDLGLEITGAGEFVISIIADSAQVNKIVHTRVVNFGKKLSTVKILDIDLANFPSNCSLYVNAKCIGQEGLIYGFRWLGYAFRRNANLGERIILLRTFGGLPTIRRNLDKICASLAKNHKEILKRTLFVIYDSGDDAGKSGLVSDAVPYARIVELRGPNYGGGGNASLLVSIFNRLNESARDAISDIIIADDDAKIDAETIVRQDGFITARKPDVISSAVVYQNNAPSVIQEFGAIWGRFFSAVTGKIALTNEDSKRLLLPYLVRSTRDVSKEFNTRYIAKPEEIEFATFIFISFPYSLLRKIGAPVPFFLRNDDVEICLRALKNGGRLVINPNLQVWHDTAHNPFSEFYAIFHGLVVNSAYGGLDKVYFYTTFLERIAKLAKAGNCMLLQAYALALEKFSIGPGWMKTGDVFDSYAACRKSIKAIAENYLESVPFEVVDVQKKKLHVLNMIDQLPSVPEHETSAFVDTKKGKYYVVEKNRLIGLIEKQMEQSIASLDKIVKDYEKITEAWANYVAEFNDIKFWDMMLGRDRIQIQNCNFNLGSVNIGAYPENSMFVESVQKNFLQESIDLPKGFTAEGYLANNPDVVQSGMDAVTHWLKYGRFEGRKF